MISFGSQPFSNQPLESRIIHETGKNIFILIKAFIEPAFKDAALKDAFYQKHSYGAYFERIYAGYLREVGAGYVVALAA